MSEIVTIATSYTATIYGTFAAATSYLQTQFGDAYTAFLALTPDDQKRALVAAGRYLDRQSWIADYDTFDERDALEAFQLASYEPAALAADDAEVLTAVDTGTNVSRVFAGGAGVDFFNPTSKRGGTATPLPPVLMALVGSYLAAGSTSGLDGGSGQSGGRVNPLSECRDDDRWWPF